MFLELRQAFVVELGSPTALAWGSSQGSGCRRCYNKNEHKVFSFIEKYFSEWKISRNQRIWDKYKSYDHRRFCDFMLEKDGIKIMIEYDGKQHFSPVRFNGISKYRADKKLKRQKKVDRLDKKFCKENNIILFRIKYSDNKEKKIKSFRKRIKKKYNI